MENLPDPASWLAAELTSGDDTRAEAAVERLGQVRETLPASALSQIMTTLCDLNLSTDVDSRWWSARALAAMHDPQVVPLLIGCLQDSDPGVRQCAALGLRLHPDPRSVPALLAALADPDPMCISLAADALGDIGEPAVLGLVQVMQEAPLASRLEAVRALAKIGDQRSIPILFQALSDPSPLIEHWASEGLERMGVGMVLFDPST
jgi:HEAT repeat protein